MINIRIYTSKECHYCDDLKEKLEKLEIVFTDVDVDDEKNEVEISKLFEFAGEPVIPIIIIKPHMLIPKRSFTTIDQAISLIQTKIEGLKEK